MKAAVFKAPGTPLVIEDVPEPRPGPTDLILKVRACGICGTDLHWSESKDGSAGWRALEPGTVMGHEFAGVWSRSAAACGANGKSANA